MNTYENLREAAIDIVKNEIIFFGEDQTTSEEWEKIHSLLNALKSALAESPRNCDVGTDEEQDERFQAFCNRNFRVDAPCSEDCPCRPWGMLGGACSIKWAQMPYEEGGAK